MYYDPTDFLTREIIEPIFFKNEVKALKANNFRLKHPYKCEDKETASYADLIYFRQKLIAASP